MSASRPDRRHLTAATPLDLRTTDGHADEQARIVARAAGLTVVEVVGRDCVDVMRVLGLMPTPVPVKVPSVGRWPRGVEV